MKFLNNLPTVIKLGGGFLLISGILAIATGFGTIKIKSIKDGMNTLYFERTLPIEQLGNVNADLYRIPEEIYKYISGQICKLDNFYPFNML